MKSKIHPTAIFNNATVSDDAEIGPYCVVGLNAEIRRGAHVGAHAIIGERTCVGENSRIGPGAHIGSDCRLDTDVDIGANAVIAEGVHLQIGSRVGAGTVVDMPVPPYAIVEGSHGAITGYVNAASNIPSPGDIKTEPAAQSSHVRGVRVYEMRHFPDLRGALTVGEFGNELPFAPKRYFLVHDVTSERVRGEHAHRTCHQFLLCTHGACSLIADDGHNRQEFRLDKPTVGVHLPPMVWGIQYKFTRDAVLLVFASEHYKPEDYIRSYEEFRAAVNS